MTSRKRQPRTREELQEAMRYEANVTRATADEMAAWWECDDPLHPHMQTDLPFHSWIEFAEQVCEPIVDDDETGLQEAMRLFRKVNPHYLALCIVMARNSTRR